MAKFELILVAMFAISTYGYPSQGYDSVRIIRSAEPNPDPHRRQHHEYSHGDYYGSDISYGQYDGHNHGRYHNQQRYQSGPNYGIRGHQNEASAVAGSYNSPFGSGSFASANSQAGRNYF